MSLRHMSWRWPLAASVCVLIATSVSLLLPTLAPEWASCASAVAATAALVTSALVFVVVRAERERYAALLRVSEELSSGLGAGDLIHSMVNTVVRLIPGADKCVLHLLDESARRLVPRASSLPDDRHPTGMPADRGVAGRAALESQGLAAWILNGDGRACPA